jgi:hypothetical protein
MPQRPKKLLDRVRDAIRRKRYSHHTEQTYVKWNRECIRPSKTTIPSK